MRVTTFAAAESAIRDAIAAANPNATVNELKPVGGTVEEMTDITEYIVRVDDSPEVMTDDLIDGLKAINADPRSAVVYKRWQMAWAARGRDELDTILLFFEVDMMKKC